jgi:GT2 family glycosyltransferase
MSALFLSVVVPTYNRDEPLCNTVRDLQAQSWSQREILIVDQSEQHDDATTRFLEALPAGARRVAQQPPNLPGARNRGIREARGDVVVFVDDDMSVPPTTLARIAAAYEDERIDALTATILGPPGTDDQAHRNTYGGRCSFIAGVQRIQPASMIGGFMTFRRSVFTRVGGFDEWLGTRPRAANEDIEFARRVELAGFPLYLLADVEVRHLHAQGGGCEWRIPEGARDDARLFSAIYTALKSPPATGAVGQALALWETYRLAVLNRGALMDPLRLGFRHRRWWRLVGEARDVLNQRT